MITVFPMITVHAQNLKAGREMVINEPFVDSHSLDRFPVRLSIVRNMIDAQEERFCFSTARTNVTTISHNDRVLQLVVVVKAMGAMLICMIDVPTGSTLYVGLSIFTPRGADIVNRLDSPVFDPFFCASLALVPSPTVNSVGDFEFFDWLYDMALFAFSFHSDLHLIFVVSFLLYYENQVKGKAQRPGRKPVGPSGPKRRAARTADDMVSSYGQP